MRFVYLIAAAVILMTAPAAAQITDRLDGQEPKGSTETGDGGKVDLPQWQRTIRGYWQVRWHDFPEKGAVTEGFLFVRRDGETLVCPQGKCRYDGKGSDWLVSSMVWGDATPYTRRQPRINDVGFKAEEGGEQALRFGVDAGPETTVHVAAGGRALRGTWKRGDRNGKVEAVRVLPFITSTHATYFGKRTEVTDDSSPEWPLKIVMDYDPATWGRGATSRGNRPSFRIRADGPTITRWTRAWIDSAATDFEIADRRLIHIPEGDPQPSAIEVSIVAWLFARPGRFTVYFDGVPVRFDLEVRNFHEPMRAIATVAVTDAKNTKMEAIDAAKSFRIVATYDVRPAASVIEAHLPQVLTVSGEGGANKATVRLARTSEDRTVYRSGLLRLAPQRPDPPEYDRWIDSRRRFAAGRLFHRYDGPWTMTTTDGDPLGRVVAGDKRYRVLLTGGDRRQVLESYDLGLEEKDGQVTIEALLYGMLTDGPADGARMLDPGRALSEIWIGVDGGGDDIRIRWPKPSPYRLILFGSPRQLEGHLIDPFGSTRSVNLVPER